MLDRHIIRAFRYRKRDGENATSGSLGSCCAAWTLLTYRYWADVCKKAVGKLMLYSVRILRCDWLRNFSRATRSEDGRERPSKKPSTEPNVHWRTLVSLFIKVTSSGSWVIHPDSWATGCESSSSNRWMWYRVSKSLSSMSHRPNMRRDTSRVDTGDECEC